MTIQHVDAYSHGLRTNMMSDSAGALNYAYSRAVKVQIPLYIRPGVYQLKSPVNWMSGSPVDVSARGVTFDWVGGNEVVAVSYGGIPGVSIRGPVFDGLTIRNRNKGKGGFGIAFTNMHNADVRGVEVSGFDIGVQLHAGGSKLAYSRFNLCVDDCLVALLATEATDKTSWMNMLTFDRCRFGPRQGEESTLIETIFGKQAFDNWQWNRCCFEANDGGKTTLLRGTKLWRWKFLDCHFETEKSSFKWALGDDCHVIIDGGEYPGIDTTGWNTVQASYLKRPEGMVAIRT